MSRDAFLARMAMGRSVYEPLQEDSELLVQPTRPGEQQYNARGEPINMAAKHRKEAMIAASNEVLAAIGVCERKDKLIDRLKEEMPDGEQRVRLTDQEWKLVREGEDDYGETIRMVAETSRNLLTWWVMGLRRRLQVGFVSSNLGFVDLLSTEWTSFTSNGFLGGVRFLTVGGLAEVTSQLMLTFVDWYLGEQVMKISKKVIRLKSSARQRFVLLRCVNYSYQTVNALLHLSVYPLASFSCLQQLGLTSSKTLLPSRSWLVPWSHSSPLRWAFFDQKQVGGSKLVGLLLSPAAIWVTMTLLQHSAASAYGHVPLFEYSCILGPHNIGSTQQTDDSKSGLATPFSRLRDKALRTLGWAPALPPSESKTQDLTRELSVRNHTSTTPDSQHGTATRHRVTELSTLPSNLLALNLDYLFWTIIMLPLDILHLTSLSSAFSSSTAARTSVEIGGFAGVTLGLAVSRMARLNKIGLCLALEFTLDTAVWGGAFVWARYVGASRYYWGRT
ncbi:hypothetical protein E4T52_07247 [Aureobasidium sp. EXF-3400]|nr:hypothetical protein E4T51_07690 [Aureobasidium sp. EXF-12344]KAI4777826.1 hypothetical protein E4T52_07247 [Aureobasidium sp. EXF-3400]